MTREVYLGVEGVQWLGLGLFSGILTVRKSKPAAGGRVIPLADMAFSALARLRQRAESFGTVEPSHYIFAAFVDKFTLSGNKIVCTQRHKMRSDCRC